MEDILKRAKIVPIVRTGDSESALKLAREMLGAGLTAIELTSTTPDWIDVLKTIRSEFPDAALGMGTIVTAANARLAIDAGVTFLVSPWASPEVRKVSLDTGVPFIEGGFTPGEVAASAKYGVAKLFPASAVGPIFLKAILNVMPGAAIIPTGGITPAAAASWLEAGAIAVGVGSDLHSIPGVLRDL